MRSIRRPLPARSDWLPIRADDDVGIPPASRPAFTMKVQTTLEVKSACMLAAGTQLGAYEIVAVLGTGGMGEVYKASDPRLRRTIAIKV